MRKFFEFVSVAGLMGLLLTLSGCHVSSVGATGGVNPNSGDVTVGVEVGVSPSLKHRFVRFFGFEKSVCDQIKKSPRPRVVKSPCGCN